MWSNSSPWIWSIPLSGAPSVLTGMFILGRIVVGMTSAAETSAIMIDAE